MLRFFNARVQDRFRTVDSPTMNPGPNPDPRRNDGGSSNRSGSSAHSTPSALGVPDATDAAWAADRATDRLAVLAHELANLLDSAMRYVSLARAGLSNPAGGDVACANQLDAAAMGLERMGELIRSAMQPCAGWMGQHGGASLALREALDHALQVVRPLAASRRVAIEWQVSERAGDAPAGPLFTVLINGLKNAVEACKRGGRVEVRVDLLPDATGRGELSIDIADDGPGPTDEARERAFEPGFTTKPGGFGVGLPICAEIVRQLGGVIGLQSRDDDGKAGALLSVRVPPPAKAA